MFYHFFQIANDGTSLTHFLSKAAVFGQTGVSLFFVLSGFLITRILLTTKESANFFQAFYLRRILRIFPLYYLYLVLYYFVLPLITQTDTAIWSEQFWYWFYLQGFPMTFHWTHIGPDHFWSLAVEEHFYLFWPLLIYYIRLKYLKWIIAAVILTAVALRIVFVQQSYETFYFTFTRMDELAMGALLAVLEQKRKLSPVYLRRYLILFIIIALPLLLLWFLNRGNGNMFIQVIKYNFISLSYFFILCIILSSDAGGRLKLFLGSNVLNFLGRISYGLYVYHPFIFIVYSTYLLSGNVYIDFAGWFLLTVAVATCSYYVFEHPFLKLKRFFVYSKNTEQVTGNTNV